MIVSLSRKPVPLVIVAGEVDYGNYRRIEAVAKQAISESPDIVLDLAEVTYLDCSGANLIFEACRLAAKRGGRVALIIRDSNVRRILRLVGIDRLPNITLKYDVSGTAKFVFSRNNS